MLRSHMDHLVITAPSLEAGLAHVRRALGVEMAAGGRHPRMGTHNAVLKLGAKLYLEIIAVDPEASPPGRPRWFRLDAPDPDRPVRLATWVARTEDIEAAAAASPVPLGAIEPMCRGALSWRITIPPDGRPLLAGVAPSLIQWEGGVHPAPGMPESGCALVRLEGWHPEPEKVRAVLEAIGFEGDFHIAGLPPGEAPRLAAQIATPTGLRPI